MMALMMEASGGNSILELLAFLSCSCVAFVGAMPLVMKETNKAHYVLAIIGTVLSQVWCLMIAEPYTLLVYFGLWMLAVMLISDFKKYWCLIVEIIAILEIIIVQIFNIF